MKAIIADYGFGLVRLKQKCPTAETADGLFDLSG